MSFETWTQSGAEISLHGAFEAGHAEAEAEMRAAMDCKHPRACWIEPDRVAQISAGHDSGVVHGGCCSSCAQIVALQSDLTNAIRLAADYGIARDALREALKSLESSGEDGACPSCGHHPMSGHTAQCVLKVALSIPASGEPARKP